MIEYELSIETNKKNFSTLDTIFNQSGGQMLTNFWKLSISEGSPYYEEPISYISKVLQDSQYLLDGINVKRSDISFWIFNEYDSQCNFEFSPVFLKKISDLGLTLCISCWQNEVDGKDDNFENS